MKDLSRRLEPPSWTGSLASVSPSGPICKMGVRTGPTWQTHRVPAVGLNRHQDNSGEVHDLCALSRETPSVGFLLRHTPTYTRMPFISDLYKMQLNGPLLLLSVPTGEHGGSLVSSVGPHWPTFTALPPFFCLFSALCLGAFSTPARRE